MEEYLIAMSRRTMSERNYWIMVVANAYKAAPERALTKTKIINEGESPFMVMLRWPNDFTWRIFVMFSIYFSVIVTVLMPTDLLPIVLLIILQHVCTIFFFTDFILCGLHRILHLPVRITARGRKYKWLIVELISLMPLSTIYIIAVKDYNQNIVFWLSSIVLLRLYRIPQFFMEEANVAGTLHIKMKLLEYLLYLFLSLFVFSILYLTTFDKNPHLDIKDWNSTSTNEFFIAVYFSVITFTNTGFGDITGSTSYEWIVCNVLMLTGYALTNGVLVGSLTTDIVQREKQREKYRTEYEVIFKKFRRKHVAQSLQSKLLGDLNNLWKYKRGVSDVNTLNLIPLPLRKEILFDIAYGLLGRSLIFSIQDRSFLRSISLAMKNKTFLPGDIILHSKRISRGMLCLSVGVIEILSREDDDTAIISFTSGTILGEVSLFMPMPVTSIIRAATYVELQVLDTVDFYRLVLKYPSNYASMRADILRRYKESRRIDLQSIPTSLDPEGDYYTRTKSLKNLIEELQENVQEQEAGFSSSSFRLSILNLYVLIENLPRVKTLPINLVRKRPWILRPDTTLTSVWNKIMFVTVTVVIFSYPYFAAFVRDIDNSVFFLLTLTQVIYTVDIFLQCITAIPRGDLISYNTSIKDIILTRLKSFGFYLDVISTYEFGVFTPFFHFGKESYMRLILSQNKLLRIWIIPKFFKTIEDDLSTNLLFLRILKYIYYTTWFIHFSSAVLYLEACPLSECYPDRWFSHQQAKEVANLKGEEPFTEYPYILSCFYALMCASGTGFGNITPSSMTDLFVVITIVILGLLIFHYCLAELSVTFKHLERKKTEFQEELFAIDRFLIEHQIPQTLRRRVRRYCATQWEYDEGTSFKRDIPLDELPKKQKETMLTDRLLTLKAVPIFKNANRGFMEVLAKGCKVRILPENEMVVYAGGFDKEMYILHSGYCEITDKRRLSDPWVAGPFTSFGDLEMIQGIPVSMTVKTLTHVRIICIEYSTYLRAVTKYPDVRREIELSIENKNPNRQASFIEDTFKRFDEDTEAGKEWKEKLMVSWRDSVINVYKYDKQHGLDYWKPFQAWRTFRFLKYLVLPFVIKPSSVLLLVWMTVRVITALLLGFIGPVYFSIPSVMEDLKWTIIFLQIVTWIDIFLSFHVAYYNEKGILIFHPAKTVVNYLKTSFVLDIFLVFPFFWIHKAVSPSSSPNLINNGPGLLKVLQFYKFLQACSHYESNIVIRTADIKLLKYVPTVLIFTNILAATVILIECHIIGENSKVPSDNSTLSVYIRKVYSHCTRAPDNNTQEDVSGDMQMYVLAYYWIITSMTTCGFGDIIPHDHITIIMVIVIVMLGVFLFGCLFASIASSKIFAHYNVTRYRAKLREMMIFLDKENIDRKMKKRFLMHYMYNWTRTLGHMPQIALSHIHTALRQDIVDRMYEKTLRKVSAFSYMEKSFMRSIGKHIDEIYFLKGETIVKHRHIQNELYIVYRGKINILGPEGKLIMSMKDGGIFGNIRQKPYSLSSITAVAATKVELLAIKNEDFHKILLNYPTVRGKILLSTAKNEDYIAPSQNDQNELNVSDSEEDLTEDFDAFRVHLRSSGSSVSRSDGKKGHFYLKRAIFKLGNTPCFNFAILSNSWLHSLTEYLTVIASYVSFILTSYVFAFQNFELYILVPYLLTDLFFYLKIFMEFHFTYIDRVGDHIYKKKLIRNRYLKSRRFYFDLCANFPLDFFAFIAPQDMLFVTLSFLRLNRLLRLYYVLEYYRKKKNTLVINIFFLEIGMLWTWLSSTIHLFACMWYLLACPIFFCSDNSWLKTTSVEVDDKLDVYLSCVYYVVTVMSTTGYGDIIPANQLEIVFTTIMLIISHFSMVLGSVTFLAMMNVQTLNFYFYEEMISMLRRDLDRQKISYYQLKKLWTYVQLLWGKERGKQVPQFINSAPYTMKCDVYDAMFGKHLYDSFVFSDLDVTFLRQLSIYMTRYVFFPENYIVQQGDNDGTMYFIHRGEVSVMTIHLNLMETIHYNLKDNDQFGIPQGLIFGLPHEFSYRAETEVEILSLTLSHWQHLFKYFPHVKPIIYDRLQKLS